MAELGETSDIKIARLGLMRPVVLVGLVIIGLGRIEDRSLIGIPDLAPDAMAAMAIQPSDEDDGSLADEPAGAVPLSGARRVPRDRIRRALRDRDFAVLAASQGAIPGLTGPGSGDPSLTGPTGDNPAAQAALDAFTPTLDSVPANLASTSPALLSPGGNVFAANVPQTEDGGGTGNGGGGADGGGGGGGGGGTTPDQNPVTAVPEPETWLMFILGFFGIGLAMRNASPSSVAPRSRQTAGS